MSVSVSVPWNSSSKAAFPDTDTDILAKILARKSSVSDVRM